VLDRERHLMKKLSPPLEAAIQRIVDRATTRKYIYKLFVAAIILRLYAERRLDLEDKIHEYLPEETLRGLHTYGEHPGTGWTQAWRTS